MDIKAKEIKLVALSEIKLNPKNRNKHPKEQIDRLVEIIKYQGFRRPVTISTRSGHLNAGEGRYLAAKQLGMENIPAIYQDYDSEEQEFADGIADNALDKWAELDTAGISEDLGGLNADFDLDMMGIKNFEKLEPKVEPGCEEDEVPSDFETRCKPGDVWVLGQHRVMCGDSTMIDHVEKLMNGEKADLIFTDPPYGLGESKSFNKNQKDYDDESSFDLKLLQLWDCNFVIWGGNYYDWLPLDRTKIGWAVWDKRPSRESWDVETRAAADRRFGQHFEIAVTNVSEVRGKIIRKTWGGFYGTAGDPDNTIVHKTQKPIELLEACIQKKHKSVLDYFGGSGSTLIACEKTDRKCFMMELDPHYCDVILARWEAYTGNKAELAQ